MVCVSRTISLICYFVVCIVIPKRPQKATEMVQQVKSPAPSLTTQVLTKPLEGGVKLITIAVLTTPYSGTCTHVNTNRKEY